MGFAKLPFAVILEISCYLDVRSLIAVADLNKDMRNLSLFYKSYWLPGILREGLVLPLPSRPFQSFSPQELGLASRRAVFRERNLSSERPRLYSATRISWPFPGVKTSVEGTGTNIDPKPLNVSWIPSFHNNGEWYFALSKDFTLRILHVRSAILVLEERLHLSDGRWFMPPSTYSLETVDDFQATIAVVTPYDSEEQNTSEIHIWAILSTYKISLDPDLVTASIERVGRISLDVLPKLFDIAGDYVVLIEEDDDWEGSGPVHLVDWKTGKHVRIPPLLRSFAVSGFPDYFISLGVDPDGNIELQVVSFPLQERSLSDSKKGVDEHHEAGSENADFTLAGSVPIRSDSEHIHLDSSDELAVICHQYTGRTANNIRLWIRDDFHELGFSVFSVAVDFSKPPKQWFTALEPPSSEEGEHTPAPQYAVEHKRLTAKDDVLQFVVPGTSGKRFFWWKQVRPLVDPDTSLELDGQLDHSRRLIRLYSADTDSLEPTKQLLSPGEDINEPTIRRRIYEESTAYLDREMGCSFSCKYPPPPRGQVGLDDSDEEEVEEEEERECVYSIVTDDWSGTVLITLMCGDLLVLRFGHP